MVSRLLAGVLISILSFPVFADDIVVFPSSSEISPDDGYSFGARVVDNKKNKLYNCGGTIYNNKHTKWRGGCQWLEQFAFAFPPGKRLTSYWQPSNKPVSTVPIEAFWQVDNESRAIQLCAIVFLHDTNCISMNLPD